MYFGNLSKSEAAERSWKVRRLPEAVIAFAKSIFISHFKVGTGFQ